MNNQNRTADGRFASVKEAQRTDCIELVNHLRAQAKQAIHDRDNDHAKKLVGDIKKVCQEFFDAYAEDAFQ